MTDSNFRMALASADRANTLAASCLAAAGALVAARMPSTEAGAVKMALDIAGQLYVEAMTLARRPGG